MAVITVGGATITTQTDGTTYTVGSVTYTEQAAAPTGTIVPLLEGGMLRGGFQQMTGGL